MSTCTSSIIYELLEKRASTYDYFLVNSNESGLEMVDFNVSLVDGLHVVLIGPIFTVLGLVKLTILFGLLFLDGGLLALHCLWSV